MKQEKPILFSTPMVKAILSGSKTMTRRVVKFPKDFNGDLDRVYDNAPFGLKYSDGPDTLQRMLCPYGIPPVHKTEFPGEQLWVRETFYAFGKWVKNGFTKTGKQAYKFIDLTVQMDLEYYYEASNRPGYIETKKDGLKHWYKRPSIFMPRAASRITLDIIKEKIERPQSISVEDCIAEGLSTRLREHDAVMELYHQWKELWISINGEESWELNPWVWCISFKKVEK